MTHTYTRYTAMLEAILDQIFASYVKKVNN